MSKHEIIAIIGQSCRFPGANNPTEFADLIYRTADVISNAPTERWSVQDFPAARWGGFIGDVASFDAQFFGINNMEAHSMDPQQRLLLELSWEALEAAGKTKAELAGSATGVFVGISTDDYSRIQQFDLNQLDPYASTANAKSIAANRISYCFDLQGPSIAIDTACSASLVAVHVACQSLQARECNLALAGGVNLMLCPAVTTALAEAGMLAKDGRCKVFDASADGYVRGEGAGVVVLKRYQDALRDQDPILALIIGSACNQDGASNGITAPNGLAQEEVVRQALTRAGLAPAQIQYIEAHGTGTLLGDPIEASALASVLSQGRPLQHPCAVGSIKTNMGHLEAAAGIAGLIKTVLVLQQQTIPALVHLNHLNPAISDSEREILFFPTQNKKMDHLQYAGVSSFGFGGTNAHVILAAPDSLAKPSLAKESEDAKLFVFSAHSEAALRARGVELAKHLHVSEVDSDNIAAYLAQKRTHLDYRAAVVAENKNQASFIINEVSSELHQAKIQFKSQLVWVFSGQGGQYIGMGEMLFNKNAAFRASILQSALIMQAWSDCSLEVLLQANEPSKISAQAQVLQVAVQIALGELLKSHGVEPAAVVGHSLGELAAAYFAGALTQSEVLQLAWLRGNCMQAAYHIGAMLSCNTRYETIVEIITQCAVGVSIAVHNSPNDFVLSGDRGALEKIFQYAHKHAIRCRWLSVDAAFHSEHMHEAAEKMRIADISLQPQEEIIPFYSTRFGEQISATALTLDYWADQMVSPVLFSETLAQLIDDGHNNYLEVGPHALHVNAIRICLEEKNKAGLVLNSLRRGSKIDENAQVLHLLADLFVHGFTVNVLNDLPSAAATKVLAQTLPLYPWQRQRYWFDLQRAVSYQTSAVETATPVDAETILHEILTTLSKLLNIPLSNLSAQQAFIELGTDSILLAKAISIIEKRYRVQLTLRQFFEELATPAALAIYLSEQGSLPAEASVLENLLPNTHSHLPSAPAKSTAAHGPYRPVTLVRVEYEADQQAYVSRFCAEYLARTPTSKMRVALDRIHLADSRASAGFRPSIKELLYPILGQRSEGVNIWDVDGNQYLDISMDFGANLFGHQSDFIKQALHAQLDAGLALAPRAALLGETAALLCSVTGMQRAVFCTTGTEAVMTAIRLARLATRRDKIIVFAGAYHGHSDGVLAEEQGVPITAGITANAVLDTIVLQYDDPAALIYIEQHQNEIAAVLVEAVQARKPHLQPKAFLHVLRQITRTADIILIFDEMITGFRLAAGGAQAYLGVQADLATYGKILGGGCPLSAIAGRADLLAGIDGGEWQYGDQSYPMHATTFYAGTFNGYPLGITAAHAILQEIERRGNVLYEMLNAKVVRLANELNVWFCEKRVAIRIVYCGSLFRFEFQENLDLFFYHLLAKGLFIWEGRNCFLSTAHTDAHLEIIIDTIKSSVQLLLSVGIIKTITPEPMSLAQKQVWALSQLSVEKCIAYQEASLLELEGKLDISLLNIAWQDVIARHSALRTSILRDGSGVAVSKQMPFDLRVYSLEKSVRVWQKDFLNSAMDLTKAPLLRAGLLKYGEEKYYLLVAAHHIVVDGWSLGCVLQEVMQIYIALINGSVLPSKPILQSTDYYAWQHTQLSLWQTQQKYWLEKLADAPTPLFEINEDQDWLGVQEIFSLYDEQMQSIRNFAKTQQCSLHMLMLAAYQTFLHKRFARHDIIVGVPTHGRGMPGSETLIAYCTHLLPMRSIYDDNLSFSEFMQQTKREMLSAFEQQDYPYANLLQTRDDEPQSLIQTVFNIDKVEFDTDLLPGLKMKMRVPEGVAVKFPLSLHILETPADFTLVFKAQQALFNAEELTLLCKQFVTWLFKLIQQPSQKLAHQTLINDDEIKKILHWNDNATPVKNTTIIQAFQQQAAVHAKKLALISAHEQLTYQQLALRVEQIATHITVHLQGDEPIVAICVVDKAHCVTLMLAVLRAGAAFLVLDDKLPLQRQQKLLAASQAELFIINENKQDEYGVKTLAWEQLLLTSVHSKMPDVAYSPERLAYVIYTSGSTGEPKGVMIENKTFINYSHWLQHNIKLTTHARVDCSSNMAFDFAFATHLAALLNGVTVVTCDEATKLDTEAYLQYLQSHKINVVKLTPSYFHLLCLEAEHSGVALDHLQTVILAGEKINAEDCQHWLQYYPAQQLFNSYGPTEATVSVFMHAVCAGEMRIPLGKPEHNIHAYIITPDQQLAAIGIVGELCLGGDCLARGYLQQPELTAERFINLLLPEGRVERVYRTGDWARWCSRGEIEFIGRGDDQIKLRGYRIELQEIVNILRHHPALKDAAVCLHEQMLVAYYVTADDVLSPPTLQKWVAEQLPEYMQPKHYIKLNAIPLNRNFKLDLKALPKPVSNTVVNIQDINKVQAIILAIWQEVLNNAHINIEDNFFSLGGDSISALFLVAKLRAQGFKVSTRSIYQFPSVQKLALIVEQNGVLAPQIQHVGTVELTPIQRWLFNKKLFNLAQYNQAILLRPRERLNLQWLQTAWNHVVRCHDSLRLRFINNEGVWTQFYHAEASDVCIETYSSANIEQNQFNLQHGPMIKIALINTSETEPQRLFIAIHHFLMDGVSWQILLGDLFQAYQQVSLNQAVLLMPKTYSYQQWAAAYQQYSQKALPQLEYWQQALQGLESFPLCVQADAVIHIAKLPVDLTHKLLTQTPLIYGVKINTLLLTALLLSSKRTELCLMLEGHGREEVISDLDYSRTIGWFTSLYPVRLALPAASISLIESAKNIEAILQAVPDQGVGYGALRHLQAHSALTALAEPDICFNYLGHGLLPEIAQKYVFPEADEPHGTSAPENKVNYALEINAIVRAEELYFYFKSSGAAYHQFSVTEWMNNYVDILKELIQHAELTLASQLTPQELLAITLPNTAVSVDAENVEVF